MQDINLKVTPPTANFVEKRYFNTALPTQQGQIMSLSVPRELWRRKIWFGAFTVSGNFWFIGNVKLLLAGQLVAQFPIEPVVSIGFSKQPFHVQFFASNSFTGADQSIIVALDGTTGSGTAVPCMETFAQIDQITVNYDSGIPLGGSNAMAYLGVLSDRKQF